MAAVKFAFNYTHFPFGNEKCVRNVLDFLEIDESDKKKLLKSFSRRKGFKIIGGYLFFLQLNKIDRQLITICIERCKKVERVLRQRQNSNLVLIETQFGKSKGNQKLIKLTSVVLLSVLGLFIHLISFINPFISVTRKLDTNQPAPLCMIIEKPFSYMVFRVSLPRSFSDGHIILTRERNLSTIVHVGPKEKQRPLKPVQPISEEFSSFPLWGQKIFNAPF